MPLSPEHLGSPLHQPHCAGHPWTIRGPFTPPLSHRQLECVTFPPMPSGRTNSQWIKQLNDSSVKGDEARAKLRDIVLRGLTAAFSSQSVDRATLEDIAQDAVVKILARISTFRGESAFSSWAITIAIRTAFDELRRARWRDISLDQTTPGETTQATQEISFPQDKLHQARIYEQLKQGVDKALSDRQRTAILAELSGTPSIVIAKSLGINRNALYKLTHDARIKLKDYLLGTGMSLDDVRGAFAA